MAEGAGSDVKVQACVPPKLAVDVAGIELAVRPHSNYVVRHLIAWDPASNHISVIYGEAKPGPSAPLPQEYPDAYIPLAAVRLEPRQTVVLPRHIEAYEP